MTALALAAALAAALPDGTARWRFEISGEHVGMIELSVRCGAAACVVAWRSERLAPGEVGGTRSSRRVEVEVDRDGRWRGGPLRVGDGGAARDAAGVAGAVPSVLAEVVLARGSGAEPCVEAFDEASGARGTACALREGAALTADVLGARERIESGPGGFPGTIDLPSQGARFLRDDAATAPREAPRLHGMVVAGPAEGARAASFCGVARDPAPPARGLGALPPPRAEGPTCRERTAAWLARARRAGLEGRTAVGVAWDGERFVWHAWPQVRTERGWIPVDPSFEQLPAQGPRFTVATYADGDERAKQRAGERILSCWGRERVR